MFSQSESPTTYRQLSQRELETVDGGWWHIYVGVGIGIAAYTYYKTRNEE
jgi:lactobin A/cerein 7B family class IIb bacteriocin